MAQNHFYPISETARILNKTGNRKLLRKLIRYKRIKTTVIGNSICIDDQGLRALRSAVTEWDARLRINDLAATA